MDFAIIRINESDIIEFNILNFANSEGIRENANFDIAILLLVQ